MTALQTSSLDNFVRYIFLNTSPSEISQKHLQTRCLRTSSGKFWVEQQRGWMIAGTCVGLEALKVFTRGMRPLPDFGI